MGTSWGRASPRAGPRRQARQEGGKVEPCSRSVEEEKIEGLVLQEEHSEEFRVK